MLLRLVESLAAAPCRVHPGSLTGGWSALGGARILSARRVLNWAAFDGNYDRVCCLKHVGTDGYGIDVPTFAPIFCSA
jgi:hypothetical protein